VITTRLSLADPWRSVRGGLWQVYSLNKHCLSSSLRSSLHRI